MQIVLMYQNLSINPILILFPDQSVFVFNTVNLLWSIPTLQLTQCHYMCVKSYPVDEMRKPVVVEIMKLILLTPS